MDVTTWYLEQTGRKDLRRAAPAPVEIVRAEIPSPEFSRFLYTAVGGGWHWTDRLPWTPEQWSEWLSGDVETWVAYHRGTPAGYAELHGQAGGNVEVAYFGLLPYAIGKGIGGHLLSEAVSRAWEREGTRRVWVHTCSLDGPAALPNYQARGFRVFRIDRKAG
ncbi:GNAT family N-acetyltransferase [Acrocarpospora phusangensis]|nr:GNAT family N-acetyltransferase [Acrocarpospora phusangensis]